MKDNIIWRKSHFFNSTMEASAELNHAAKYLKSHVKEISLSEIQKENYATLFESAAEIIEDQNNTIAGLEATIQMRDETIDVLEEQIGELNYFIKDLSETLEPIYQNSGMSGTDGTKNEDDYKKDLPVIFNHILDSYSCYRDGEYYDWYHDDKRKEDEIDEE